MKKISILACFVLGIGNLFAQTTELPPATLPINSIAAYKAYALSQVRAAEVSYQIRNAVATNFDYSIIGYGNVSEVMDAVNRHVYSFDSSDVGSESVTTTLFLLNSDGQSVLYGNSTDQVQIGPDGKATFSPKIEVKLLDWVPIKLGEGAGSLEIRVTTEWGYKNTLFNEPVYSGFIWIPINRMGDQYEYVVHMKDGSSYVYLDGERTTPTEVVSKNSNFKINQFYDVKIGLNNDEFVVPLIAGNGVSAPTFRVKTTVANAPLHIDSYLQQKDGSYERPARAYWFSEESPTKVTEVLVGPDGKVQVTFPSMGTYFLAIEFQSLEALPYVEEYGGGKGY